jgi:hypothetical protein
VVAAWRERAEREPARSLADLQGALENLQLCGDFRAVQDPDALARLPQARRVEWEAFWADVAALRDRFERLRRELATSPGAPGRARPGREGKARNGEKPDGPSRQRDDLLELDPEGVGG